MKQIDQYITEKFKLSSKNIQKKKVKTFVELKNLIACEYEEQGHPEILDLNHIDITELDNLIYLFDYDGFKINNVDVSDWDVSNIRDFQGTFMGMHNFDCDLSNWDVSKANGFESMFFECYKFKGKGLEHFDLSNAKDIQFMIAKCNSITDEIDFNPWFKQLQSVDLKHQLYTCLKTCKLSQDVLHDYRDKYLA